MIVQVEYRAAVLAYVNLETKTVTRVVIVDDSVHLPEEGAPVWTEDGNQVQDVRLAAKAVSIAESETWPAWEIGL